MSHFDFAIIGGDQRQIHLHNLLLEHGYSVICYGITPPCAAMASSLDELFQQSNRIIAPIPFSRDGVILTQLPGEIPVPIYKLTEHLNFTHTIIAGNIPCDISSYCKCIDLMKQETFVTTNSLATAEAAAAIAILHISDSLWGCPCLITGYGYCAKALAHVLSQLNAAISISARSADALTDAAAHGFSAIPLSELTSYLNSFSIIFNTIPSPVFSKDMVMECSNSTLYLELASSPGGLAEPKYAEKRLSIFSGPGLPGRYSPLASAKAIFQQVINMK